ncbi:MAG: hypothetical protein QOH53_1090, partial [Ilumatobacteraceae bacterium]
RKLATFDVQMMAYDIDVITATPPTPAAAEPNPAGH